MITYTAELPETGHAAHISALDGPVTTEYFLRFIQANPELRTELTAEGEMIVMAPAASESGHQNSLLTGQLYTWARQDRSGRVYDSSAGFTLPNGAIRSPDASWISKDRLAELRPQEREGFMHICPDFVAELRSSSDRLPMLRLKMSEYLANGTRLGLLIDPIKLTVHIYRPLGPVQVLENPEQVDASPELPGFILDLRPIFDPEF